MTIEIEHFIFVKVQETNRKLEVLERSLHKMQLTPSQRGEVGPQGEKVEYGQKGEVGPQGEKGEQEDPIGDMEESEQADPVEDTEETGQQGNKEETGQVFPLKDPDQEVTVPSNFTPQGDQIIGNWSLDLLLLTLPHSLKQSNFNC